MPAYTDAQRSTALAIWTFWKSVGGSDLDAAAWVANADGETSFVIHAVGDDGQAIGLAQHHKARRDLILANAGIDMATANVTDQCKGIYAECTGHWSAYRKVWDMVRADPSLEGKVRVIVGKFEQSGSQDRDVARRTKLAEYWLSQFGGATKVVPITPVAAQKLAAAPVEMVKTPVTALKPMPVAPAVVNGSAPSPLPIPSAWLSKVAMKGIVVHWSAGANKPTDHDLQFYHILIAGDGTLVRGTHTIADNVDTSDGVYAAHTLHHNTGIIGVSLCGMLDAVEQPFSAGPQPINEKQWAILPTVLAQLCRFYGITPDRRSVLSHAEVQDTLGIPQRGKWDISRLPWDLKVQGAHVIGDAFRKATADAMKAVVPVA